MTRKTEQPRRRIFGWCNDNLHSKCWASFLTVGTNEMRHCECECHEREDA